VKWDVGYVGYTAAASKSRNRHAATRSGRVVWDRKKGRCK